MTKKRKREQLWREKVILWTALAIEGIVEGGLFSNKDVKYTI